MREEILERAKKSTILGLEFKRNAIVRTVGGPREKARVDSGTTVLAFHFNKGILFAGDRREMSGYWKISSQRVVKVHKVANFTGFCFAGSVSHGQLIKKALTEINLQFFSKYGEDISIEGQANFIGDFCLEMSLGGSPLEVIFIIGGIDDSDCCIYELDADGYRRQHGYISVGSGSIEATTVLDGRRRSLTKGDLSKSNAVDLAMNALLRSGERDFGTSSPRLELPIMATITRKGFDYVHSSSIAKSLKRLLRAEGINPKRGGKKKR